ncbi:MAG: pyridoxamine 5'-phosphate oxidase family protein [Acidobacteria bacterium]|nr:pyridoxamine 5'-phosphate oxidase family protein [Acidobacteriota bacterium]
MPDQTQGQYDVQRFKDLIHEIPFAMFTTVTAGGGLRSRPMVAIGDAFDGSLWFFSRATSPVAQEIDGNSHVNVTYVSAPEDRFVTVSGNAVMVRDVARARQMWNPTFAKWFTGGADDAELSMIKVVPTVVEYWDRKAGRMQQL